MPEVLSGLLRKWIDLRPIRTRGGAARPKAGDLVEIVTAVYHDCWNGARGKVTLDMGAEGVLTAVQVGKAQTLVAVIARAAWQSSRLHGIADLSVCGEVRACSTSR